MGDFSQFKKWEALCVRSEEPVLWTDENSASFLGGEEELGEETSLAHEHNTTICLNIVTHLLRMYLQFPFLAIYIIIFTKIVVHTSLLYLWVYMTVQIHHYFQLSPVLDQN